MLRPHSLRLLCHLANYRPHMGTAASIDETFRALADPTRRRVVERLCAGPASMTELAQPFPITLPSLSKHLRILEESGLVRSTKRGRVRTFRIVPGRLQSAETWLARQRSLWERRLDQLDEHLKTLKEEAP
jgi:DNA-binding transcriptional ArsR family regulator